MSRADHEHVDDRSRRAECENLLCVNCVNEMILRVAFGLGSAARACGKEPGMSEHIDEAFERVVDIKKALRPGHRPATWSLRP